MSVNHFYEGGLKTEILIFFGFPVLNENMSYFDEPPLSRANIFFDGVFCANYVYLYLRYSYMVR